MSKWIHKTKGEFEGELVEENKSMIVLKIPNGDHVAFLRSNLTEVKE